MKYMLFICVDPEGEELRPEDDNIHEWVATNRAAGKIIFGERLRPVEDATTVRVRGGKLLVTDGPFAESKEWIAGFDWIEADNLDEAISIASKHPMARAGRIEVRPAWPFE